jgi:iron complex outermembrane receptor protein
MRRRSFCWLLASGALFSPANVGPLLVEHRVLAAEAVVSANDESTTIPDDATIASADSAKDVASPEIASSPFRLAYIPSVQPYSRPSSSFGGLPSAIETPTGETGAVAALASTPVPSIISLTPPIDTTQAITEASGTDTVRAQRRSPLSYDPRIRGFRQGQIYAQADGALWRPAREDLDSMLSKISPSSMAGIRVINGPYGVTYGPGFAFIDVETAATPRYACGPETHNTFGINYRTNGNGWYGYETVEGGSTNYGFRFGYGNRNAIDYEAGNGERIPSSYLNQDFLAQYGYDLNPFQRLEFRYQHLDQTDTEYFGKFFDLDALITDGFTLRLVDESPDGPWTKFVIESWYNRTDFHGGTGDPMTQNGKSATIDRVEAALRRAFFQANPLAGNDPVFFWGDTNGFLASTGARAAVTFGEEDESHLTFGADVRYLTQRINEHFTTVGSNITQTNIINAAELDDFGTNQPRGTLIDPGVFAEIGLPWESYWTTTVGARLDWLHTDAREAEIRTNSSLQGFNEDMARNNTMYAFYLDNNIDLDQNWELDASVGHAHRPPTLTERYADGVFLGIFQNGFTRVIGNPFLNPERAWQADLGLSADYGNVRGGVRGFYSWILDYATYEVAQVGPGGPLGAQLVRGIQTDLATIAGFEVDGAYDWNDSVTLFSSLSYIEGRDQDIDQPLTQIYPLEGRVGIRLHDPSEEHLWGLEFFGRLVAEQDRLGALRSGPNVVTVEQETPGFTVWHLRGYFVATRNIRLMGGVENLFDRNYLEHLDLRLPASTIDNLPELQLLAPGITPYVGMEWNF